MPALQAVIGANSQPFQRELMLVQRAAARAGVGIQRGISAPAHAGLSGSLRETVVLIREISRGNLSRVPGSLSILLSQLGVLKLLTKDNASAAKTLAEAWAVQSAKADVFAAASRTKAAASELAFTADEAATEATMNGVIAERVASDQAQLYAAELKARALAARDAAAAEEALGTATTTALSPLGIMLGLVVAVGAAFFIWNKRVEALTESLAGVKLPDLTPQDISRLSAQEEGWKKISSAIENAAEAYDSVTEASNRYDTALKKQQETETKLLEMRIKSGQASPDDMLALESEHRRQNLEAMKSRRDALKSDAAQKKQEADSMHVSTEKDQTANGEELKKQASAAREHLSTIQPEINRMGAMTNTPGGFLKALMGAPKSYWKYGFESGDNIRSNLNASANNDYGIIAMFDRFQKGNKGRGDARAHQRQLYETAAKESGEASRLDKEIAAQPGIDATADAQAAKVSDAARKPAAISGHMVHGYVSSMQSIGGQSNLTEIEAHLEREIEPIKKQPGK